MKKNVLATVAVLLVSSFALAQAKAPTVRSPRQRRSISTNGGSQCGQDPLLITDGSSVEDFVALNTPNWYLVHLKAGHSYSVEVWDAIDSVIGGTASLAMIATDCITTIPTTSVTSVDPDLSGSFGARVSWIQAADTDAYVQLNTSDPSGNVYEIRVTDTTLLNPRWSTFSGFIAQYALVNNTSGAINGTLTVYDNTGAVLATHPVSVPAFGENFQTVSTPINHFGFSTFSFVGPAGAVTADAYFINGNATVIVPSTFSPRNFQH